MSVADSLDGGGTLDVAIVGCGAVTRDFYGQFLRQVRRIRVQRVADLRMENARAAATLFGCQAGTIDQAVNSASFVIVATPPEAHASIAAQALSAGRDVCVEKPFTTSRHDAEALLRLAEENSRRIYVAQFRRMYPKVALAREMLTSGLLGPVVALSMHEGARFNWQAMSDYFDKSPYGGVLFDTGSHTLDLGLFATGLDEGTIAAAVTSVTRDRTEPAHEIDASFRLTTPEHAVNCRLHLSRVHALANLVRVECERGTLEFDLGHAGTLRVKCRGRSFHVAPRTAVQSMEHAFVLQYHEILSNPATSVLAGRRFLNQIAILEAVHRTA